MLNLKEWYNDLITNPNLVKQPLLIGEIGINHNGDIQLAKTLFEFILILYNFLHKEIHKYH